MTDTFTAALIQTTTGRDPAVSMGSILPLITEAAARGADWVMLPETVAMMEPDPVRLKEKARSEGGIIELDQLRTAAHAAGVWLLVGSLVVRDVGSEKLANRSFLIDPSGAIVARYDKIHLFDVELASGERYRESANYTPGETLVTADTPWGCLGMSICYDLRFPHLYRALVRRGALFLSVPAAFTRPTGQAHWHALLRARAIENGCFVFAPAQCGEHEGGRRTYGHSLIVDPWGEVIADGGDTPGIVLAKIDVNRVAAVRAQVPSLDHDRPFS